MNDDRKDMLIQLEVGLNLISSEIKQLKEFDLEPQHIQMIKNEKIRVDKMLKGLEDTAMDDFNNGNMTKKEMIEVMGELKNIKDRQKIKNEC